MQIGMMIDDINIPIEGLCYADISEIRNVFSNRRHDLWLELVITSEDEVPFDLDALEAKREAVYNSMNEMSPIGRCNRILRAVNAIEEKFRLILDKEMRTNANRS